MNREPAQVVTDTVTVTCLQSVTASLPGPEGQDLTCAALADLEAFCAALRRLGAGDDLAIDNAADLTVVLERS